jgi:hypothetical protein
MAKKLRGLERQKWSLVAEYVQKEIALAMYSPEACKERFEALRDGSAVEPLEHRENPDEQTVRLIADRREQLAYVHISSVHAVLSDTVTLIQTSDDEDRRNLMVQ